MLEASEELKYNAFSRMVSGNIKLDPEEKAAQKFLDHFPNKEKPGQFVDQGKKFLVKQNLLARAKSYTLQAHEEGSSTASMAKRHEFLISRDLRWQHFNVLTLGIEGDKQEAVDMLKEMKSVAQHYCKHSTQNWSTNVKFFFQCYPYCNMKTLHLHMVDETVAGEAFGLHDHRNLYIDDVIRVIQDEIAHPVTAQMLSNAEKERLRRAALYDDRRPISPAVKCPIKPHPTGNDHLDRAMLRPTWGTLGVHKTVAIRN